MPQLPPVVGLRRRRGTVARMLGLLALVVAAAVALAGCAKFNEALGERLAVVEFAAGTGQSTMMKVRAACAKVPQARPLPIPSGLNQTTGKYDVQYRIDHATAADVARLEQCLSKYPSVKGIRLNNPGEDG